MTIGLYDPQVLAYARRTGMTDLEARAIMNDQNKRDEDYRQLRDMLFTNNVNAIYGKMAVREQTDRFQDAVQAIRVERRRFSLERLLRISPDWDKY